METKIFDPKTVAPVAVSEKKIQAKLEVTPPHDEYEQEADMVADKVSLMTENSPDHLQMLPKEDEEKKVQMKSAEADETISMKPETEEDKIQMSSFNAGGQNVPQVSSALTSNLQSSKGQGSPISGSVNREMGQKIGSDFSNVRVHTDANAVQMNKKLGAQAFTHGTDIYFNSGKYNPENSSGKHLLAHELTHTVQQNRSSGTQLKMIQRDLAVEPTVPEPVVDVLSEPEIDKALKYNQVLFTDTPEIAELRDVLGISREPSVIDRDFINAVVDYQASFGLDQDGMLGPGTAGKLADEITAESDFLEESAIGTPLRRVARRLRLRSMVATNRKGKITHQGFVGPDENPQGAVTVRVGDREAGNTNLISMEYTGENADNINWLQFISMQMFATPPAAARVYNTGTVGTTGGNVTWSNATVTNWFVDAVPATPGPLYNSAGLNVRTAGRRITIFDGPGGPSGLPVAQAFAAGAAAPATSVTMRMSFDSYVIRNNKAVYHVRWDATTRYNITAGTSGDIIYHQGTAGSVSSLSAVHRTALLAEYPGNPIK